jgi:hypothetical protein
MRPLTLLGTFEREEDLLRAAASARREGWSIADIYSPYPLHGSAEALGLPPSRLPRAAFLFGLLGVGTAFWFQIWTSAQDWPLNVGGRPLNSLPAFVPVGFEMMVLFAGLGTFATWLLVSRLYPGKSAAVLPGVTDDRFVLEVQGLANADVASLRQLFAECNATGVEERES